jgi:hypothetical protein
LARFRWAMIADKLGRKPSSVRDCYREILLAESRVAGRQQGLVCCLTGTGTCCGQVRTCLFISMP